MKYYKYLFLGIAAFAFASCNEKSLDGPSGNLSFKVVLEDESPSTRSSFDMMSEDGKTCFTLEAEPMTKSAQINHSTAFTQTYDAFDVEGHEGAVSENPVFHGRAVYNQGTGKWDLVDATYTWIPNKQIEIVAAASNVDNTAFFNGITYNGNPSTASFEYSLPNDLSALKDPLFGYFKGPVSHDGTVSLKFNHPLTSLVFKVGRLPLGAKLQVNSITLTGIDAQAHCVVSFNNSSTTYKWTNHTGRINYKQEVANPAPQNPDDVIFDETSAFIVIPRVFPNNSEAKIIINITEDGRTYDIFTPLAGTEWKAGETNIYALSYHGDKKAILESGPDFNRHLKSVGLNVDNIHKVVFEVNSPVTSGTQVQAPGSKAIYMNYDGSTNTITVSSDDYEIFTGTSCNSMFSGLTSLTSIEGMENVNTKNTNDMKYMFTSCTSMTSFPLEHLDTRNVTSMAFMFRYCTMTSIDLSPLSSESLLDLERFLDHTPNLTAVTFGGNFTCKKVYTWGYAFASSHLRTFDASLLTPENAGDIEYMFYGNDNLLSVDISSFAASNNTIYFARGLFERCHWLASINMGGIDFSHLRNQDEAIRYMMNQTSTWRATDSPCNVTCLQEAKDVMTLAITEIRSTAFTWRIITPEP